MIMPKNRSRIFHARNSFYYCLIYGPDGKINYCGNIHLWKQPLIPAIIFYVCKASECDPYLWWIKFKAMEINRDMGENGVCLYHMKAYRLYTTYCPWPTIHIKSPPKPDLWYIYKDLITIQKNPGRLTCHCSLNIDDAQNPFLPDQLS